MQAIFVFVAITYILSIAVSLGVWLTGGHESHLAFPLGATSMFIPAVAVLVLRLAMGEKISSSCWRRFPVRYLPIALLLIPIVWHSSMLPLLYVLEGGLPWQDWLTPRDDGLYHSPESQGWGTLTTGALVGRILLKAAVGFVVVSLLAFFEEIGWRAWLLPRLADRIGPRRAVIAVSAIWAFWHTPAILSGIHNLEGAPRR